MSNIEKLKMILLKSDFSEFEKALDNYTINEQDEYGNILHYYIKESESLDLDAKQIINLLIKKGLNLEEKQRKGRHNRSPLHLAVFMKLKSISECLIDFNANINSTDGMEILQFLRLLCSIEEEIQI